MSTASPQIAPSDSITEDEQIGVFSAILVMIGRNKTLVAGFSLILLIGLFSLFGTLLIDPERTEVGAGKPAQSPSSEHLLGTDQQGRDVFADLAYGTPASLIIGLIAGVIGVGIGTALGFLAGYYRGYWDTFISLTTDVFLTIPALLVLVVIASMTTVLSIEAMGLLIGFFAWMGPARTIRSQVLSLRDRSYVDVAKFNGVRDIEIIWRELVPTLMPYIAASFVGTVAAAILASIGLSALGLGPQNEPSLGLTIYWSVTYGALIREMWWWFGPPIVVIVMLFIGLFLMTAGLDQVSNPRLRTSV
ncbi:MAG: ABC transporter permease [Chloroflexi bacterium]|jgi:peptide/nickel transport system permease protein|nr:ABC transporter permease [Chloroflexota bacterium]